MPVTSMAWTIGSSILSATDRVSFYIRSMPMLLLSYFLGIQHLVFIVALHFIILFYFG